MDYLPGLLSSRAAAGISVRALAGHTIASEGASSGLHGVVDGLSGPSRVQSSSRSARLHDPSDPQRVLVSDSAHWAAFRSALRYQPVVAGLVRDRFQQVDESLSERCVEEEHGTALSFVCSFQLRVPPGAGHLSLAGGAPPQPAGTEPDLASRVCRVCFLMRWNCVVEVAK